MESRKEYLDRIVAKLMADPDWELPPELRFMLVNDLAWTLLYV